MASSTDIMAANPQYVSFSEIKQHNNDKDCWIIVHSKVFDVSSFHTEHPGGSAVIMRYAGTDATAAYDEIHAPGIIEEALPARRFVGVINPNDHEKLPEVAKAEERATVPFQRSIENKGSLVLQSKPPVYTKPELFKLISAHDFEDVARNTFTPKAFAFYSSAATDLVTHQSNSEFYKRIMIRPRVMRNVKEVSIRRTIMGCDSSAPFFVSPAAMARLAHPDGELALVRGCGAEGVIQIISSNASFPLADIIAAGSAGQPFFLQLYMNTDRQKSADLLRKARSLGVRAIFVTVDAPVPGKREADERIAAESFVSPISGATASNDKKGGGMGRLMAQYIDSTLSWTDIPWIKEVAGVPVVLKGVQSAADARLAVAHGADGILLSNHGGRSLDTTQPAILTLLELHHSSPEVFSQIEVYVDGGITRGTDILKAIALGATAVGIGRPYLYSLAYGAEGVQHLTEILKDELATSMRLCGVTDLDQLNPGLLNTKMVDHLVGGEEENHPYIRWRPKAML